VAATVRTAFPVQTQTLGSLSISGVLVAPGPPIGSFFTSGPPPSSHQAVSWKRLCSV
jgi:hypothetical protein